MKRVTKNLEKIHRKRGKGLKNASFWVINSKLETLRTPGPLEPLRPPSHLCRKLKTFTLKLTLKMLVLSLGLSLG